MRRALALALAALAAPAQCQVFQQLGSDLVGNLGGDVFGESVAISADASTIAIGSRGAGGLSGSVFAYRLVGGAWSQIGSSLNGEAAMDNAGISVSLSANGQILALGANQNDGSGIADNGHVRVYSYDGLDWLQIGESMEGEAASDRFGQTVCLSADGSVVASGALLGSGNLGHVRVFRNEAGAWTQLGSTIVGPGANSYMGIALSLSADGTVVAAGARGFNSNLGRAFVYEFSAGDWVQRGGNIEAQELDMELLGSSVALNQDGTILTVGAPYNDEAGSFVGKLRTFQYSAGTWTSLGEIFGKTVPSEFGWASFLSADGTMVAVSSLARNGHGGRVSVYRYANGQWTQFGEDMDGSTAGDFLGWKVAMSGDGTTVIASAPYSAGQRGYVRVFQSAQPPQTPALPPSWPPS
jgi:hypothetical protein